MFLWKYRAEVGALQASKGRDGWVSIVTFLWLDWKGRVWWKKATWGLRNSVKNRWDQWLSPASRGLLVGNSGGRFACCHLFSLHCEIIQEWWSSQYHFPHSCWEGVIAMQIPTFEQHWSCYFCSGWFPESQIWTWSKEKRLLDAQPAAPDPRAFRFSAAGGTMLPFLLPIPNLKWWVICHGPKGSRKAWPNLTKPEGHKKDFQLNVSDLLALPIPSQLQRANNFNVMAMGEEAWRGIRKLFLLKTDLQVELHTVCTNTLCAWLVGGLTAALAADTKQQQQFDARCSVLGTFLHLMQFFATWLGGTDLHSPSLP